MTGLLIAETQRFVSRRMTRYFPLALALLFIVGVGIAYLIIQAEDGTPDFVGDLASFGSTDTGPGGVVAQPEGSTGLVGFLGPLLPIMAFTLGASFFGADQKSGVIELLLTWQPRRLRLLAVRALGGGVVTVIIAIVLSAFFVALMYGLASITGTTDGMTGQMWGWLAASTVRSGLAAGMFFLLGLGLTVWFNNSLASIISFVGYAFVVEGLLQTFVGWLAPYLPMNNAAAFVSGANVLQIDVFGDSPTVVQHGYLLAGLLMLVYAAAGLAVGMFAFNRRDIA